MKKTNYLFKLSYLLVTLNFFFFFNSLGQDPTLNWAIKYSGDGDVEVGSAIISDNNDDIVSTGYFDGNINIGGTNLSASGISDVYIHKATPDNSSIWTKRIGSNSMDVKSFKIATDQFNNIYIYGLFTGNVDFNPSPTASFSINSTTNSDYFILKLDPNGNFIWAKSIATELGYPSGIKLLNDGKVIVAGTFMDSINFTPIASPTTIFSDGSKDSFIACFDSNGNYLWNKKMGSNGMVQVLTIAVDNSNNIYSAGIFSTNLILYNDNNTIGQTSIGTYDGFTAKLDSNGDFVWVTKNESTDYCFNFSIDVTDDFVAVGGYFFGTTNFSPPNSNNIFASQGLRDQFVQKLDNNGNVLWVKTIGGGNSYTELTSLKIKNDIVYNIGRYNEVIDIDPGSGTTLLDYQGIGGVTSIYLQKLNTNGDFIWGSQITGNNSGICRDLMISKWNNIYSIGYFKGTLDFDVGNQAYNLSSTPVGNQFDIFIQKLNQCYPVNAIDSVNACNGFTWINGNTYYSSTNTPVHTLTSVYGCDSIVNLNLIIRDESFSTDTVTACETYTWLDGITYTQNNSTAIHTLVNSAGCDSIVQLDLTLNYSIHKTDVIRSCNNSYTWRNGVTYTNDNSIDTYTVSGATVNGCDSIYHLDLTLSNFNEITQDVYLCENETITIGSNTYSEAGNYTDLLTNQYGCDSIVNTNIYIDSLQLNVLEINHVSCGNDGRIFFDVISNYGYSTNDFNTFNESTGLLSEGSYTYSISDGNGCSDDTVITIVNRNSNYVKVTNLGFQDETDVIGTPEQGLYNLPPTLLKNSSNPRNVIEPGTPVRFKIFVSNNRENGLSINSGEAILTCSAPSSGIPTWANLSDYITVSNNSVGINNIPWGGSGWSSDAFEIIIDSAIFSLGIWDIQFELKLQESGDVWETTCIHFPLTGLWLDNSTVDDDNFADSQGNSNSLCESLEVIEFTPRVSNGQLNEFVVVKTPYGTFEDLNNYPGIIIWDGIVGVNGPVEDGSWWNYFMNQPNTIVPGDFNTVPQYDFVFDYNYTGIYEFILHTIVGGGVELFNNSNTQTLLKWGLPYTFNEGYPTAPNCDNFNVNITVVNETIEDAEDGSASVTVQGGVLPYSYEWSDGSTGVFNNGLAPGNYSIVVMDSEVCSDTIDFTIQPAECNNLSASVDVTVNSSSGANDGTATVVVTGGNSPFTYYWSSGASTSATSTTDLAGGEYNVTVVDNIGCEVSVDFNVGTVGIQELIAEENYFEIKLYPNPTNNEVMLDLGKEVEQLKVELIDLNGKVLFQENYQDQQVIKTSLVNQATGMYYIRVKFNGVDKMIKVIKQ